MSKHPAFSVTAMLGASMFFSGVTFATTLPYGAIVGIETLGMSNADYAALVSVGALVGAVAAVLIGYVSDRLPDRRVLVLASSSAGALGYGLIYLLRNPLAFSIAVGLIIPFGVSIFSQSFSYARAYYSDRARDRADFMISLMRTIFSAAWVVVPPVAGLIAAAYSVFDVYLATSLAYIAVGALFALMMLRPETRIAAPPKPETSGTQPRRLAPGTVSGLVGILIITLAMRLVGLSVPLSIVTDLGGTIADVGLYAGIAALMEIPFMLGWGYLAGRISRELIIVFNALLFGLYIFLASRAGSVLDILLLQAINGIASAALLSITISYIQDAIRGRIGLSTSLMDVIAIAATLLGAAAFGVLSAEKDYRFVLTVASVIAVAGGLTMLAGNLGRMFPARRQALDIGGKPPV